LDQTSPSTSDVHLGLRKATRGLLKAVATDRTVHPAEILNFGLRKRTRLAMLVMRWKSCARKLAQLFYAPILASRRKPATTTPPIFKVG
jgi:hypothetical protein